MVVDFQELGGGVNVVCAPGPVTSGLEAMRAAGVAYQTAQRFPGFVCRIAGQPTNDPCVNTVTGVGLLVVLDRRSRRVVVLQHVRRR